MSDDMHPDVRALYQAISHNADELTGVRAALQELVERRSPDAMTAALSAAIRQVRDEPATEELFIRWSRKFHDDPETTRKTYNGLATHASDGLAKWIGNRVITIIGTAIVAGALAWWVITSGPQK